MCDARLMCVRLNTFWYRFLLSVVALLPLVPSANSKDTWVEVRSPNFVVLSNAGDKEARKIADQFEQFREVFRATFPKLRLDLGKPLIIFAVKNQDSLRMLIPGYWEEKGRIHPDGIYVPGEERHYVAVRTDVESENPYQVVYHEYTHAIMNLNFRQLPVWLGEGLAEFYGNSVIHEKDVDVGLPARYHLETLRREKLIPIDALLLADSSSPYYNEANHATMFYAESWTIVHYLMMDPDARKNQLLAKFITAWDANGDQVQAAEKAFGDLKKFGQLMEAYSRQGTFYKLTVKTTVHGDPKSFANRVLPEAEVNAQKALFYAHTQRPKEAAVAVAEALKEDPNLALAYEAQGFLSYSQSDFPAAEKSFAKAIALGSGEYFPYYFSAETQLRSGLSSMQALPVVTNNLEKAIQMNPQFAPAYAALSSVYSMNAETREKAFAPARKAMELEPGNFSFATNYGYVLANGGKTAEAKVLAQRIQQAAKTPMERANAQQLLAVISSHEEYDKRMAQLKMDNSKNATAAPLVTTKQATAEVSRNRNPNRPPALTTEPPPAATASAAHPGESEYATEGYIVSVDCGSGPGKLVIGTGNKSTMQFRFPEFAGLEVASTAKEDSGQAPACTNWKGRWARLYFYKVKAKDFIGDLNTIQFF